MTAHDATRRLLAGSPRLPADGAGPVFAEPWQAQAFALAVQLQSGGAFTWSEWTAALSARLVDDPSDDESRYYQHWLAALEALVIDRGIAGREALARRKRDWAEAFERTAHGRPVEL